MKAITKQRVKFTALAVLVAGLVIGGLVFLNFQIMQNTSQGAWSTLSEIMKQQSFNFSSKLNDEKVTIKVLADSISFADSIDEIGTEELAKMASDTNFEVLTIALPSGEAINNLGQTLDLSMMEVFKAATEGNVVVSNPFFSFSRQQNMIMIAAPIMKDGVLEGVLAGSYTAPSLNKLFLSSFGGKGYAYVADSSGNIIAETRNDYSLTGASENLIKYWGTISFYGAGGYDEVINNISMGESGRAEYEDMGQKRMMDYEPLGINDWYIFSIVPEEVIAENAYKIVRTTFVVTFLLIVLFLGLLYRFSRLQKRHIKQLSEIAFVDEMTGAPTLAKFKMDAQRILEENTGKAFLLVKIDIDRFKIVNQMHGFDEGNTVLKNMAKAMKASLCTKNELYARVHADEFVMLHEYVSKEHVKEQREMFLETFTRLMGEGFVYDMSFPSGHYYLNNDDCMDISAAVERANTAHRKAKKMGQELFVYDESITTEELSKKRIENMMEQALKNEEFELYLQPKVGVENGRVMGAEALVRWRMENGEIVSPGGFIPLFEENGFITKLDMYMFEKVCKKQREWSETGQECITISVNFSRLHLNDNKLVSKLCSIAEKHNVPKHLLEIELTESAIFENEQVLLDVLAKLHQKGFTLSMDDFGTGYSSLGLLKNIPVDTIKIDRSFFVNVPDKVRAQTVLLYVLKMTRELGIKTVAEGVEHKDQVDLLTRLGCDAIQGFYYAKPMPCKEFLGWRKANSR